MGKIKTIIDILNNEGVSKIFKIIKYRTFPTRIKGFNEIQVFLKNKSGLEIGGPSWIFMDYNLIPIYKFISKLDGCNFSSKTIWEGNIKDKSPYKFYKNKTGTQYVCEATDLKNIPNEKYDFLISSHCLEHTANPIKALEEWLRVLKHDGAILIVLPNKDFTFDHKRSVTSFTHLMEDYKNNMKEDDFTHLDEILKLHDLQRDIKAGTFEEFKERSLKNYEIRALHHHVFDIDLLKELFNYFNIKIILTHQGEDLVIFGNKNN